MPACQMIISVYYQFRIHQRKTVHLCRDTVFFWSDRLFLLLSLFTQKAIFSADHLANSSSVARTECVFVTA